MPRSRPVSISPHLSNKLRAALGNEAGEELIGLMDDVTADVSSLRGDMAELRHQMEIGFARIDAKFEAMGRTLESELRKQTRFFFLAWSVLLAAIVGLYAR